MVKVLINSDETERCANDRTSMNSNGSLGGLDLPPPSRMDDTGSMMNGTGDNSQEDMNLHHPPSHEVMPSAVRAELCGMKESSK